MRIISFFLFFSIAFSSCIEKECQIAGDYEFIIPVTLTPAKDTFRIGDTITITSQFPDVVYERKTDKTYVVADFKWYPGTSIYSLDSLGEETDLSGFDFYINPGFDFNVFNYSNGTSSLLGQYNYADNEYFLEYKIVPRRKGGFFLSYGSAIYGNGEDQEFQDKCSNISVDVKTEMNNRSDNNVDFLLDSPEAGYQLIWQRKEEKFFDFGGYCFYVKE